MKKINLLISLFLTFLCVGCDGNFGVLSLDSTYLIINNVGNTDVELFCESEKIWISTLKKCDEIISEKTRKWISEKANIENTNDIKIFDIPSFRHINDRNNIDIYFEVIVNNEKYKGSLYIKSLQEDSGVTLFSEDVVLKSASGKELSAIFYYQFWRSI